MEKTIIGFVAGALLAALLMSLYFSSGSVGTTSFGVSPALGTSISSSVNVGPDSNIRVVASTSRSYLRIENASSTTSLIPAVYCSLNGDASAVSGEGILLASTTDEYYEIYLEKNPYDGSVRCTTAASTTLIVTELKRR